MVDVASTYKKTINEHTKKDNQVYQMYLIKFVYISFPLGWDSPQGACLRSSDTSWIAQDWSLTAALGPRRSRRSDIIKKVSIVTSVGPADSRNLLPVMFAVLRKAECGDSRATAEVGRFAS